MQEQRAQHGDRNDDKELSYHAVNGIKVKRLYRLLDSPSIKLTQLVYVILDEPSRTLAFFFQRASEGQLRRGRPFLQDLSTPTTSPVVACLQYWSGMLSGGPPMSRVVWQSKGNSTIGWWAAAWPAESCLYRRTLLSEASKTKRRHAPFLCSRSPFVLTSLVDDRATDEYKWQVLQNYDATRACCARPGLLEDLKTKGVDMREADAQDWLLPFAVATTLSLGNTERQHAHNKAFCGLSGDQAMLDSFVAQSVLHQAKCTMTACQRQQERDRAWACETASAAALPCTRSTSKSLPAAVRSALDPTRTPTIRAGVEVSRRPKARSPKELFKADFISKLKMEGSAFNCASAQFWKDVNKAWAKLPAARIKNYEEISNAEKTIAKDARATWRANRAILDDPGAAAPSGPVDAQLALPGPPMQADTSLTTQGDVAPLLPGLARPSMSSASEVAVPAIPRTTSASPDGCLPLSPSIVDSCMVGNSLADLKLDLTTRANHFQQARAYRIPDVVDYGSQCRGLCSEQTPAIQLGMQELVFKEWARIFDSPRAVNHDALMMYEVYGEAEEPARLGFFLLTSCSSRYGRHPAHQDFLLLDLVGQQPGDLKACNYECTLEARRLPYVRPHREMARQFNKFFVGAQGELDIVTEECRL